MNRSVSAGVLASRHGPPESSPGPGSTGKTSPIGHSHHTPSRPSPYHHHHHHHSSVHAMLMGSALRVAIAVVIIFATGCTVGSVLRLEYYLHRTKAHAGAFLDDPQAGMLAGRLIKRTHQVWAVRTETFSNQNAAANADAAAKHAAAAAALVKPEPSPVGSLLDLVNVSQGHQPAMLHQAAGGKDLPAAGAVAAATTTDTPTHGAQAAQALPGHSTPGATAEVPATHQEQLTQQLHHDHQLQQGQQHQEATAAASTVAAATTAGAGRPHIGAAGAFGGGLPAQHQQQVQAAQQATQQAVHPHAQRGDASALRFPGNRNSHVTQAMEAALQANPGALPVDFDWRLYLAYYPDLTQAGITTEASAKGHYVMIGRQEKRLYRPLPITLRYTACGGLMNQHYSHLAALALAVVLNANVVVPPALSRNSFLAYFSQDPSKNKVTWSAAPTSSMWDTAYLHAYWKERGINITEAPPTIALPDMTRPESAYPTWLPQGYSWDQVARLGSVYLKALDMGKLAADALHELALRAIALKELSTPLLLDLPCTLFMLDTSTAPHLVPEVARALRFAPRMHALAQKVLAGMGAPPTPAFNGLHLRMEADAKDWANILGGRDQLFRLYMAACQRAGFTTATGMYLASGMFTYKNHSHTQQTELQELKTLSSRLYYKELYLQGATDLAPLTNEQQALIDFLVLAEARHFVGISVSTFSYFLREYRLMRGLPASTSTLVDGSRIGTERLFHQAGRVILT